MIYIFYFFKINSELVGSVKHRMAVAPLHAPLLPDAFIFLCTDTSLHYFTAAYDIQYCG